MAAFHPFLPFDPAEFDKAADAMALFDERRSHAYPPIGGGSLGRYVGGELQVAEVSEQGVTGFTLHNWRIRSARASSKAEAAA